MAGFLECIEGVPADKLFDKNSILRDPQHKYNDLARSLRPGIYNDYPRLMASAVGTFVSGFVLGIGDRHQGNMMVANDHSFFNIDFGFTFGERPLLDTADFPIPFFLGNYIKQNGAWEQFMEQMWSARNVLMEYEDLFLYLATYMKDPMRIAQVRKTFDRTLNRAMFREMFKKNVESGKYYKLFKDVTHRM